MAEPRQRHEERAQDDETGRNTGPSAGLRSFGELLQLYLGEAHGGDHFSHNDLSMSTYSMKESVERGVLAL